MAEALQIITESAPPPEVPLEKPRFVWPPEQGHSLGSSNSTELGNIDSSLTPEIEMTAGGNEEGVRLAVTMEKTVSTTGRLLRDVTSVYHTAW
jgi:interleukin-1 receptor-associated kinase 1